MDSFTLKDIQLSVQRQVVVIFGGSNVGQYTFRGIAVGMCHYGHGSGYDTTVGEPVFRTDDAFHIESGGTDSILFAHFLSQLRRSLQRKAFRHGNDNLLTGKGRVDGLTGVGSDLFREAFTETIVAILRCDGFPSGFLFFRYRVIDIGRRLETDAQLAGIFGKMTFSLDLPHKRRVKSANFHLRSAMTAVQAEISSTWREYSCKEASYFSEVPHAPFQGIHVPCATLRTLPK